jgi:GAF domain-containing protein
MAIFDESADFQAWIAQADRRLTAAESRADAIEAIRATARAICGSDGICLVLREGDLCHYVEEDAIAPLWKGHRFPLGTCISGWSMLNAKTAVIEDVFADPRIPHDAYRPTFVKSLIMTPVGQEDPVAAIGAYWQARRSFTDEEVARVKTMSLLIGMALCYIL